MSALTATVRSPQSVMAFHSGLTLNTQCALVYKPEPQTLAQFAAYKRRYACVRVDNIEIIGPNQSFQPKI